MSREKLIELIAQKQNCGLTHNPKGQDLVTYNAEIADHLLANGVTVQRWIPVTERLPEKGHRVLGFTGTCTQIAAHMGGDRWWTDYHDRTITAGKLFTHWMPLPEPPKEV